MVGAVPGTTRRQVTSRLLTRLQAEMILDVTGLAWDGTKVVHNPQATSIRVDSLVRSSSS
eukprot:766541-Hanusia_phi.AAC.4